MIVAWLIASGVVFRWFGRLTDTASYILLAIAAVMFIVGWRWPTRRNKNRK